MAEKTAKKTEKKAAKTVNSELKIDVYDVKGEKVGKIALSQEVFGVEAKPALISQAVRVYLENQRVGTRNTKTRSEVAGSTRKLFRQKGTGRARAGSIKSPIQVGGGIVHGPKPYDYHLDMSQKMRKKALFGALTGKFQADKIRIVNNLDNFSPKTKNMVEFLNKMNITGNTLLVTDKVNKEVRLAGRNLENLDITQVSQLNTYIVMNCRNLIFVKNSLQFFSPEKNKTEVQEIKAKPKKKS